MYDEVFMLFLLPVLSYVHTAKKLVTSHKTARSSSTDDSTNYPQRSIYRISNRLTGEYPQLIEDIHPACIQIIISVIHLPPSNPLLSPCAIS